MQLASSPQSLGLGVASEPQALDCNLVIALNVVDLDNYVSKEELRKMHVMTWGNEIPEEEINA
jgi:hypothetical protein